MQENNREVKKNYEKEIKDLLDKNLKLNQEMYAMLEKVNKYIIWQRIFSVFKILIIIIPLILGIIYLPPLLSGLLEKYRSILNIGTGVDVNNLLEVIQKK